MPLSSAWAASNYAPAATDDPFLPRYVAMQSEALQRIADRLTERLPEDEQRSTRTALALFAALQEADRRAIFTYPLYQYWWLQLCRRYRSGQLTAVREWLRALPSFVIIPSIKHGALPQEGLTVPVEAGDVRFPAHAIRISLGAPAGSEARVTARGTDIHVTSRSLDVTVARDALLERCVAWPRVWRPQGVGPATIDVDGSDPWTHAFLHDLSKTETPPEREAGELRATSLDPLLCRQLGSCLQRLRMLWPQMAAELETNVRLFVPIISDTMEAFTNTGWQGGIFLRTDFDVEWFLLERLVHESSHLRLNLIMATEKIHNARPEERLPSPFRAGLRPVNGLYHGAFVFTRSAEVLVRLYGATHNETVRQRVAELRQKAEASFGIIERHVPLTAFGQSLFDEIRTALAAIAH